MTGPIMGLFMSVPSQFSLESVWTKLPQLFDVLVESVVSWEGIDSVLVVFRPMAVLSVIDTVLF